MKILHRIALLIALSLTALICYVAGNATGTVIFIISGVALELLFWLHLIPSKSEHKI